MEYKIYSDARVGITTTTENEVIIISKSVNDVTYYYGDTKTLDSIDSESVLINTVS